MRSRLRMGSVSRRTSERAREQDADNVASIGELFARLRKVVEDVAQAAALPDGDMRQEPGGLPFTVGGRPGRVVFGYSIRTGLDGGEAEPFGDLSPASQSPASQSPASQAPASQSPEPAARAPIVDVFVEGASVCVIAELPGAADADIRCTLDGCSLLIEASGNIRYRKTVTLPGPVDAASLTRSCQNGILEVRLIRMSAA